MESASPGPVRADADISSGMSQADALGLCANLGVCPPTVPKHCDHSCLVRMHLPDSLELRADMGVWPPTVPEI